VNKATKVLKEITIAQANYVSGTHIIQVDQGFETVAMIDKETSETDWFLQGHEAARYIEEVYDIWREADVNWTQACQANAKLYIDSL
jgi:hypothetical protein